MELIGRTCIITGATGGLGRHLAARFWQEGASLLLAGRNPGALHALSASLPPAPNPTQKFTIFCGDLAARDAAANLIAKAREEFPALSVLVNNAAVQGPIGPIWENSSADWEETLKLNLAVPAALCALVLPWMLSKSYGKIMNISGGGSTAARPHFSAYAAAKAGLVRLTETLAQETASVGIDVNAIAPGAMPTKMLQEMLNAGPDRVGRSEFEKVREQSEAGDAAFHHAVDLATFLASAASDGITGRLISALWDNWRDLPKRKTELQKSDIYTLRRIGPKDRGRDWDDR